MVLSGAIASYETNAVQFTTAGRATRVEAVVRIQATLRDAHIEDEVLWSQSGLVFREQFDVPDSGGEFFDRGDRRAGRDRPVAPRTLLINSILEGF